MFNSKATAVSLLLTTIISALIATSVFADDTLLAYWSLDETVEDLSGNENHGEINGDPAWVEGKAGKALEFDGVDDFVFVEDSDSLDVVDALTLEAWIKPASIPGSGERKVVYKSDAYLIKVKGSKISSDVHVNGWIGSLYDTQPTPLDEWYHVAVVYDGTAEILYINAVEVDRKERAGKISVTSKHLGIGAIQKDFDSNPYDFFEGIIDEIKIYSRSMDADELTEEMESTSSAVNKAGKLATMWGDIK